VFFRSFASESCSVAEEENTATLRLITGYDIAPLRVWLALGVGVNPPGMFSYCRARTRKMIRGIITIRMSKSNPSETSAIFVWSSRRIRYSHLCDRDKLYFSCQDKYPRAALQEVAMTGCLVLKNLYNAQKEILHRYRIDVSRNGERCPVTIWPASKVKEWRL
jgi:hypothetical protein